MKRDMDSVRQMLLFVEAHADEQLSGRPQSDCTAPAGSHQGSWPYPDSSSSPSTAAPFDRLSCSGPTLCAPVVPPRDPRFALRLRGRTASARAPRFTVTYLPASP